MATSIRLYIPIGQNFTLNYTTEEIIVNEPFTDSTGTSQTANSVAHDLSDDNLLTSITIGSNNQPLSIQYNNSRNYSGNFQINSYYQIFSQWVNSNKNLKISISKTSSGSTSDLTLSNHKFGYLAGNNFLGAISSANLGNNDTEATLSSTLLDTNNTMMLPLTYGVAFGEFSFGSMNPISITSSTLTMTQSDGSNFQNDYKLNQFAFSYYIDLGQPAQGYPIYDLNDEGIIEKKALSGHTYKKKLYEPKQTFKLRFEAIPESTFRDLHKYMNVLKQRCFLMEITSGNSNLGVYYVRAKSIGKIDHFIHEHYFSNNNLYSLDMELESAVCQV